MQQDRSALPDLFCLWGRETRKDNTAEEKTSSSKGLSLSHHMEGGRDGSEGKPFQTTLRVARFLLPLPKGGGSLLALRCLETLSGSPPGSTGHRAAKGSKSKPLQAAFTLGSHHGRNFPSTKADLEMSHAATDIAVQPKGPSPWGQYMQYTGAVVSTK